MKRTIIISKAFTDSMEAYVQNIGIEETGIIESLKKEGLELKEDTLSDNELALLLKNCIDDDCILEGIFSIDNSFNHSQKEINKIKENIESKYKSKGYTIIPHTDKIDFNINKDKLKEIVNTRNYLLMLQENIDVLKKQEKSLIANIRNNSTLLQEITDKFNKLSNRYINGKKYLEKLEYNISNKEEITKEINQDNKIKNKLKNEIDKLERKIGSLNDDIKHLNIIKDNLNKNIEYKNTTEMTDIKMWRDFLVKAKGISIMQLREHIDEIRNIVNI